MKLFQNRISKKNLKNTFILLILVILFFISSAYSYASVVSSDLKDSVFRLHVIANSNSSEDQDLKYLVRDELLKYMNTLINENTTKEDVIKIASLHKEDFENIAKKVIYDNGYSYPVSINIGNYSFPTKNYGDIILPSGYYDALRVCIGEANGKNWWCVMFPPLCFVDVSSGVVPEDSKENLQKNLSDEEYELIQKDSNYNDNVSFKFKLVELFENIKIKMAEK